MNSLTRYLAILEAGDGERIELGQQSRWDWERRWRHAFASRLYAATGKWVWHQYDWHVFSYQYARALSGDEAIAEYLGLAAPVLIVIPEQHSFPALPAFRLTDAKLPQFLGSGLDVLVWPEDLSWTMAFTHEEGWCGPFFSRREWVVPDGCA
jgi:Domain of unknown function (DUF4275)